MIPLPQSDIIEFLKTCEKPVTGKEIADALDYDPTRVFRLLRGLLKFNEVSYVEYSGEEAAKRVSYVLLRRTRFFFLPKD